MATVSVSNTSTLSSTSANSNTYIVENGGVLTVSGTGVVLSDTTIEAGGLVSLTKGAMSSTVLSGGMLAISGGNTATGTTLDGGAEVELLTSGATLSGGVDFANGSNELFLSKILSASALSGATLSGFSATDEIVVSGGYTTPTLSYVTGGGDTSVTLSATSGTTAETQTFVFSGTSFANALDIISTGSGLDIVSGQGQTVSSGATMIVQGGESAASTNVDNGGTLYLSGAGATASNTTLVSGGTVDLATAGAELSGTLTFSGGGNDLVVGAIATAGAGDQAVISGFGATDKIDIAAISASGASLAFATSNGNEVVTVSGISGGSNVSESFVFSGTSQYTSNTMSVGSDGAGGAELLYNVGQTISVTTPTAPGAYTVASGDTLLVLPGGSVSAVDVQSGGFLTIDGGVDAGAVVSVGADETVESGSATGDQISGSATVASGGVIASETVAGGGSLIVSGGVDSSATVLSNGAETVSAGGSAGGDQIFGSLDVNSGTINGETVESGGSATLGGGASDTGMTILSGGVLTVSASTGSAVLSGDQISGVVSTVSGLAATFTDETVFSGGVLNLFNSNNAIDTTVFGGGELVLSGKETATNTTLSGGGTLLMESPKATLSGGLTFAGGDNTLEFLDSTDATFGVSATISGFSASDKIDITSAAYVGADLTLSLGSSDGNTIATVDSGGTTVETFTFAGAENLALQSDNNGGENLVLVPTPVTTSVTSATASGAYTETPSNTLLVLNGGSVIAPTIQNGAFLVVDGGVDSGADIQAGGVETISSGSASGDQIFGSAVVSGGSVSDETVQSGGALTQDGGSASNIVLNGGAQYDLATPSATVTGSLTFANGGNTLLVNALSNAGAGDQAVISGFSSNDKIEVTGIGSSGASLNFTAGPGGEEIATVSGAAGSESFIFDNGADYNASTMSLAPDGSGVDLVLDTTPVVSFTSLSGLATNQPTDIVNGTVDASVDPEAIGTTVTLSEGATVVGTGTVGANGDWSANVTFTNDDGANVLTASDTDKAGNTGVSSQSLTTNVDTSAPAFTAGNLVVSISGDGDGSGQYGDNQASPITLEQLTTSGSIVSQLVLPQTTTVVDGVTEYAVSGEYGSSSEGTLELSADGHSLVIAGYGVNDQTYNSGGAAVYGNAALAQSTSVQGGAFTAVPRVIADINANGVVDSSTALYNVFNTNNPRSVATVNGSSFYITGQGVKGDTTQGIFYASDGASSATAINTATDTRTAEIYNGQLYVSADSTQGATNISDYGDLPTSATTPVVLNGLSNSIVLSSATENNVDGSDLGQSVNLSPENFFFANADTLYVADGGAPKNGGLGDGGLQKWVDVGGTWTLQYTLSAGLNLVPNTAGASSTGDTGLIGLTGEVTGNTVTLYATTEPLNDLGTTSVVEITDQLDATSETGESFSTILTASPGENIRGIAFAPTAVCFASGASIRTPAGDVAVENLTVGEMVVTASGAHRPIRWIGHRTVDCRNHPRRVDVLPVRIRAHAFGADRPARDLYVSPGHAICVDVVGEALIPASALVNGSTVTQVEVETVVYWHVELDEHDILVAENLPTESYLDMGNRSFFAGSAVVGLAALPDADMSAAMRTHADFCRPFHDDGPVPAFARKRLRDRATKLGWSLETADAWTHTHLLVDGLRVEPEVCGLSARFALPAGARDAWLVSDTFVPLHVGLNEDGRRLGLDLAGLLLEDGVRRPRRISLDDPLLSEGFHDLEGEADVLHRWTAGRANLSDALSAGSEGPRFLRVDLTAVTLLRWVAPKAKSEDAPGTAAASAAA